MQNWPTELTTVVLAEVHQHPSNPQVGDLKLIKESMRANGFLTAIVVQKSTGYVLAGNHRVQAARELGIEEAPAIVVDLPDDMAERFLLADNRTADEAPYDPQRLAEVLGGLAAEAAAEVAAAPRAPVAVTVSVSADDYERVQAAALAQECSPGEVVARAVGFALSAAGTGDAVRAALENAHPTLATSIAAAAERMGRPFADVHTAVLELGLAAWLNVESKLTNGA